MRRPASGRIREFLHAKASDRQDILSSLLGYQLYEELQSRANSRAREKRATATALETTLAGYDDATEQQVNDLDSRASQLSQLQTWLAGTGVPSLGAAAQAVTETGGRLDELTAQQRALATVQVPPDVAALDAKLVLPPALSPKRPRFTTRRRPQTPRPHRKSGLPAPARAPHIAPAMG